MTPENAAIHKAEVAKMEAEHVKRLDDMAARWCLVGTDYAIENPEISVENFVLARGLIEIADSLDHLTNNLHN